MALVQYIYITTNRPELSIEKGVLVSAKSVEICEGLGMTGRVFSTHFRALSIIEGPRDVMSQYFEAVETQPQIATVSLQSVREIKAREFDDYSVWLDLEQAFEPHPNVYPMTPESLQHAMPAAPSARLRVIMSAFFKQGRLVA